MRETERQRAVELVRRLMRANDSDSEFDSAMTELESLVPDPNVSNLIFWPSRHELSRDLDEADLTPDKIVELANQYKPFAL